MIFFYPDRLLQPAGLCYASVSFLFFSFFNDRSEQRDLGNYKTDLIEFSGLVLVSRLVKGRCHGNQF